MSPLRKTFSEDKDVLKGQGLNNLTSEYLMTQPCPSAGQSPWARAHHWSGARALSSMNWHTKNSIYTIFSMWTVYEHRNVPKQLRSIPIDILKRYEKWKDIVSLSGPQGLRLIKGFHDESLRGEWKGHRSSRLGHQFRVIYRVEKDQILVKIVSVTAHDYRKK